MSDGTASFSDYIVFVDESGDHGLSNIDPCYPVFVLVFCLIKKEDYISLICPGFQRLKFRFWGHDEQVLHEHEIRKPNANYSFLMNPQRRGEFLFSMSELVAAMPFQVVASVIRKQELAKQYVLPENPYELSLQFGLERIFRELDALGEADRTTHIVVESRGNKEDKGLELAFRRICDKTILRRRLPFELLMIPKSTNSTGLQLADLIARPIGIKTLRPDQQNQAYDILTGKFRKSPKGEIKGWGLKIFP